MTRLNKILKREIIQIHTMQMIYFACGVVFFIFLPSFIFTQIEEWSMLEAVYFCTITLTKIGFGDYVPRMSPPERLAMYSQSRILTLRSLNLDMCIIRLLVSTSSSSRRQQA
jgi:hypothetical protein